MIFNYISNLVHVIIDYAYNYKLFWDHLCFSFALPPPLRLGHSSADFPAPLCFSKRGQYPY